VRLSLLLCRQLTYNFRYFPLFDADRAQIISAYVPTATISISANTLPSRSALVDGVQRSRSSRPNPTSFEAWTSLPGRNFFRTATSIDLRMRTLKSPANQPELLKWWNSAVPKTRHPLDDASKWCIDAWILDGEGVNTKLCAMIEGQFEERTYLQGGDSPLADTSVSPVRHLSIVLSDPHPSGCATRITVCLYRVR